MEKDLIRYGIDKIKLNYRKSITTEEGSEVSLALHSHSSFEIFVLESDLATFFAEGSIYPMTKGDMMLFNGTELHNISFDNSTAYKRTVIHFKPETVLPYETENYNLLNAFTARKPGKHNLIKKEFLDETGATELLEKIANAAKSTESYTELYIHTLFIQLLICINEATKLTAVNQNSLMNNEKINNILSYINTNLDEDLSLDSIAEKFYMSKYNMCHTFKQVTGFSVKQYITYKRVSMAQKLMASGKSTLEACVASGFNDYSNFYKTFKKILGKPPKSFK